VLPTGSSVFLTVFRESPVSWTHTRSKIANAKRKDPNADVTDLRTQLKAERISDYLQAQIDAAPPLTQEQRAKLAELLAPVRRTATESPPTESGYRATGGKTSTEEKLKAAHLVLVNSGIRLAPSKVSRIVRDYERNVDANGFGFFRFLANAVQLSAEQQRAALSNPDVAKAISYADPTGEQAVHNVLLGSGDPGA
jgi:hypothetical protein